MNHVLFLDKTRVVGHLETEEIGEYLTDHVVIDRRPDEFYMDGHEAHYIDGELVAKPITPPEPEPSSQVDVLGQELTQMKIKDMQQQAIMDGLGRELTNAKLEIMQLKGARTS